MRYLLVFLFTISSTVIAQEVEQASSSKSGWGVYGGISVHANFRNRRRCV